MSVLVTTVRRLPTRARITAAGTLVVVSAAVEVCAELGYEWAIIVRNLFILVVFLAVGFGILASPIFAVMAVMAVAERRKAAQKARGRVVAEARAAEQHVIDEQARAAAMVDELHDDVIDYASRITVDRHDADAVIANAAPLMAWLREASTVADVQARRAALRHQYWNCVQAHRPSDDDPAGFLAEAAKFYAFAQNGKQAEGGDR